MPNFCLVILEWQIPSSLKKIKNLDLRIKKRHLFDVFFFGRILKVYFKLIIIISFIFSRFAATFEKRVA